MGIFRRKTKVRPSRRVFGRVRSILFSKWMLLAGLVAVAWQGWQVVRPKPWAPNELQQAAAERVCWQAAEAIPAGLPDIEKIAVVRLGGRDVNGYISKKLAECMHQLGRYEVLHETFIGKLMRELGIDEHPVTRLDEAVKAGKQMGVSGVVFGNVPEFTSDQHSASVRLNLRVANVKTGEAVFADSFAQREPPSPASLEGIRHSVLATAVIQRVIIWLAFAVLLPLVLVSFIKHLLTKESNAVNFAMLAGLTLADLAVAFLLCGLVVLTWLPGLAIVAAAVAGGAYNYWVCSRLEELR